MISVESNAERLFQARTSMARLNMLPVQPETIEDAYACQQALVDKLLAHFGGHGIGYKIACTNVTAQRQLHVDGPFYGRMTSDFCFDSPARIEADRFFMRVVEAEFAFLMSRDLAPRSEPHTSDDVAQAVAGVMGGIEIVDSRYDDWTTIGAPSLIADNACHGAWVKGKLVTDWRGIDLASQAVRLRVTGADGHLKLEREGCGRAVLGHPLNAMAWLANRLSAHGAGLKAGEFVTTGVTMEVYMGDPGDRIQADFGPVGVVELEFT